MLSETRQDKIKQTAVIDITMQLFDNAPLLNRIVDNCYEIQLRKNANFPTFDTQLAQTVKEIDNVMNAIKQGIITATTKETLLKLEEDKENLEIRIAKEQIERPALSKKQIKYWICKFGGINLDDANEKQRLIDVFVNSIYVYNDKMVITFNYQDGDRCVPFDEINEVLAQKENPDNHKDYQGSPSNSVGGPSGIRTPNRPVMSRLKTKLRSLVVASAIPQNPHGIRLFRPSLSLGVPP